MVIIIDTHFLLKPKATPRPRFSAIHNHVYNTPEYTSYKNLLSSLYKRDRQYMARSHEAVKLEVIFQFIKGPKNTSTYHTQKPDLDNLIKAIKDAGNNVLWYDDCNIIEMNVKKQFGIENKILIRATVFGENYENKTN